MKKYIILAISIVFIAAYYIIHNLFDDFNNDVAAIASDVKHPASNPVPMPPVGGDPATNKPVASTSVAVGKASAYIYVSNLNSTTVSVCPIMTDGSISNCGQSGNGFNAPSGLALTHDKRALYVTNQGSNEIDLCMIDKATGQLNNCTPTGNGFNAPSAVAISNNGQFAYVVNENSSNISICQHDRANKSLANCSTILANLASPSDINFAPETNHVYIANTGNNSIIFCTIGPGRELIKCHPTGSDFSAPQSITISANDKYAYIANQSANSISLCQVDSVSGEFSNCQFTGSGFNAPSDFTLNSAGNMAYVSNASSIMSCNVNLDGTLTNCLQFNGDFNHSTGIRVVEHVE